MEQSWPKISDNPAVQRFYENCREEGTSHSLAEMFATGQTPFLMTDSVFLEGTANGRQFQNRPDQGDAYAEEARKAGVDITGKVYKSGLAAFPGDPEAWVGGRGDVQRLCEKRGWGCDGAVKVKRIEGPEQVAPAIAPDLVNEEVQSILETCPEPERVDVHDLREQVIEKRKPPWAK